MAQWLYSITKIDIHDDTNYDDTSFQISCKNGHLELASWIYSLDKKYFDSIEYKIMIMLPIKNIIDVLPK